MVLLPLLICSCTKKDTHSKMITKDSTEIPDQRSVEYPTDSSKGVVLSSNDEPDKNEMAKTFRIIDGDRIIKTINANMIPLTISDEFTTDQQKLILKIKNFKGKEIVGKISSKNADMNLRFNQIKFADGSFDGPFGRAISIEIPKPGEIWLIIGKNLMADGKLIGKFSVSLQQ